MEGLLLGFLSLIALVILLLLGLHVGVALGLVAFVGIWLTLGAAPAWGILSAVPYDFAAHWSLSSVPMFLLMGYICYHAGLTAGLFTIARVWLTGLPGGLGVATVGAAAGFSALTGSTTACAAAMCKIAVPEMFNVNYDKALACGVVAAAGTIGSLIPPSIIMIVYGIFAEVPISHLFAAGVLPGLLTAMMFMVVIVARASLNPSLAPRPTATFTWRNRFAALREAWPLLAMIVGVFGGLFSGVFTATEAGAVGAGLSLVVAAAKGTLSWQMLRQAFRETLISTAVIFVIAIGAALMTRFLAISGVPEFLSGMAAAEGRGLLTIILGISVVYLFLGMFLDPLGIMLLTLPIFLPILNAANVDLVWFGILMVKLLEIGLVTPPVGLNVFVVKSVVGDKVRTETIFRGILPFLAADLVTLSLLILFPEISLYLTKFVAS